MFQRDYLMRMIGQMTEVLGQVLQLRKERKQEEAVLLLDELLDRQFGLSSKLLKSLSDEDLLKLMSTNGVVQADNVQAVAIMFKQQALLHEELGNEDESYALGLKSLHLFMRLTLLDAPASVADPSAEAKELLEKLEKYELPVQTKRLQAEWYEAEGQYDLAENGLYELLEDGYADKEELEAFYRRLLLYEDDKLEAGGLPRGEVETGLADLSAYEE